jgi:hypothetical protein
MITAKQANTSQRLVRTRIRGWLMTVAFPRNGSYENS